MAQAAGGILPAARGVLRRPVLRVRLMLLLLQVTLQIMLLL